MSFLTSIPINNIDKTKKEKKTPKKISNNKNNNKLIKKNSIQQNLKKFEEKYLSYIIKSDTKFIDVDKIENKFKNIVIEKYNKFNSNKIKIQNLKKEYNLILNEIQTELLNNYSIYNNTLINFFDKSIKKYTNLIKIKQHEISCYKNVYNRLHISNYSIKKRIESELKNDNIQLKQYSDYNIIKNLVLNSFNTHSKTLKNMRNYEFIEKEKYEKNIMKKLNKINDLEFQINLIKDAITYEDKNILKEINKQNKIKNEILNEKKKNNIIIRDIIWIGNYYFKIKIIVLKILQESKIKDINLLITKFNNMKQKYQNLSSKFIFYNLEIKRLKTLLTKYNDALSQILNKNKTKNIKINLDNYDIKEKIELNFVKFQNNVINDNYHKSLFLLQKNIIFMEERLNNFNKFDINYGKYSYKMNLNLAKLDLDNKKTLKKTFLNIIKLFFKFNHLFHNSFFYFYENCILNEYEDDYDDDDVNNDNNNKVFIKNLFNKEDFEIYKDKLKYFFKKRKKTLKMINENNEKVLTNLKESIKSDNNAKKNNFSEKNLYNNFINFLNNENNNIDNSKDKDISSNNNINIKLYKNSKSKNNILNSKLNKSLSNSYGSTTITSNNILFNNYKNNTFNHSFINKHPRQIMRVLGKYQSNLIIKKSNKINYLKEFEKNKINYDNVFNNSIKSLNIKNKEKIKIENKENSEKNFLNLNKLKHNYNLDINEESDYSIEEKNLNKKEKINLKKREKIKKYKFFRKEPEMNLIYNRSIDLKQLNLNYYDKKEKSLEYNNSKFNELYYNFQKKNKKNKKNSVINKNFNLNNNGNKRSYNKFLTTSLIINLSFKNTINKKRDISFYNKNKIFRRRGGSTIEKNPQNFKKLLLQ